MGQKALTGCSRPRKLLPPAQIVVLCETRSPQTITDMDDILCQSLRLSLMQSGIVGLGLVVLWLEMHALTHRNSPVPWLVRKAQKLAASALSCVHVFIVYICGITWTACGPGQHVLGACAGQHRAVVLERCDELVSDVSRTLTRKTI